MTIITAFHLKMLHGIQCKELVMTIETISINLSKKGNQSHMPKIQGKSIKEGIPMVSGKPQLPFCKSH